MAETLSFPYETSILIMGTGCLTDSFSHRDFIFNIFYYADPCNAGPFFFSVELLVLNPITQWIKFTLFINNISFFIFIFIIPQYAIQRDIIIKPFL